MNFNAKSCILVHFGIFWRDKVELKRPWRDQTRMIYAAEAYQESESSHKSLVDYQAGAYSSFLSMKLGVILLFQDGVLVHAGLCPLLRLTLNSMVPIYTPG